MNLLERCPTCGGSGAVPVEMGRHASQMAAIRRALGWTRAQLGRELLQTDRYIAELEAGARRPDRDDLGVYVVLAERAGLADITRALECAYRERE